MPHSLKLFGWCGDLTFDPLDSAGKGSHPRFYRSQSLSLLWLLGILSQRREKICTIFICLFFWGGFTSLLLVYLNTLRMQWVFVSQRHKVWVVFYLLFYNEPKFSLVKKWYELFTSCNVFCMKGWHFRNFQIRVSLCSPCHYIFRAYITKNFKETCTMQGPIHRCQNVHYAYTQRLTFCS